VIYVKINDYLYWFPLRKPVHHFLGRGTSCNVFVIDQGDEIWLIDIGIAVLGRYMRILSNMRKDGLDPTKIKKVFITHAHPDHVNALAKCFSQFQPEVYIHELDGPMLAGGDEYFWAQEREAAGDLAAEFFGFPQWLLIFLSHYAMGSTPRITNFIPLKHQDSINGPKFSLQLLHTPGHTLGHACYYIPEIKALFCGDLMDPFFDHKPPINLATSDYDAFKASVSMIVDLDVEIFCPAHAAKIYFGKEIYRDICLGVIKQLEFAKTRTIELLSQLGGMRLKNFRGKYPSTIWQILEHVPLAFAVIKSLEKDGKILRNGKLFQMKP
jgi:glyoxylase-like metal-dependent hydrolase (beta-lactamase superfamily II)